MDPPKRLDMRSRAFLDVYWQWAGSVWATPVLNRKVEDLEWAAPDEKLPIKITLWLPV